MSTTDGTEAMPPTNTDAATDDAMALRQQRSNVAQRRLNQGLWLVSRIAAIFDSDSNNNGAEETWREVSGKPPRQRRRAHRRNPAD